MPVGKHTIEGANKLVNYLNQNKWLKILGAKVYLHGSLSKGKKISENDIDIYLWQPDPDTLDYNDAMKAIEKTPKKYWQGGAPHIVGDMLENLGFKEAKGIQFPHDGVNVVKFTNEKTKQTIELWFED